MAIKNYFNEIKNRIILLILFYFTFFIFLYKYRTVLIKLTILINEKLTDEIFNYFIFTSITELFSTYIDFSLFCCNLLLYFQFNYHFICFLNYGLYLREYYSLKLFFNLSKIFGILSFFFTHLMLFPILINFFIDLHTNNNFYFEAKIYEYINFYKKIHLTTFIYFQLITILFTILNLAKNYQKQILFINNRKYTYFLCLTIATLITPPDILSQLFTCCFLIGFVEIIVFTILLEKQYLTR